MTRKWTLDRIEFDNETYEITRPDTPTAKAATSTPAPYQQAVALQLLPAVAEDHRSPGRAPFPVALVAPKTGMAAADLRNREHPTGSRRLH